ncbi:hypothetical protein ASG25_11340 [Rhizobium sp. Leaf384]|uniref:hypothetical protein n=1 Tax=unclassified Rhizobium TaxID=2613769 RepID=UPI000713D546|nr:MULTISPECIES: hypothetical protein [unclassified Rhizobium]KQS79158.1 hypothetical protein ASG25_11340 [Rhizobium sp. Leaf384]KQS82726.1 hypothetical protein ASG58_05155 [Rhizobium sp. Leaf383]
MAGLIKLLMAGVVDGVLKEILKKSGTGPTKRAKRQARTPTGMVTDLVKEAIVKAVAPKKQVSRKRTAAARSKQKRG